METPQKHIVIVAGEASGDMHAACLVKEIKSINPNTKFSGLGGAQMKKAGVELYENLADLAVVGFVEVLKHLAEFRRIFRLILEKVRETKADAVILVDYPGFNLRFAEELKKQNPNIKVIYYISPQVWAWKENRVQLIKQYVDKMLVLFQFEQEFYSKHGMDVDFVGHPLLDLVKVDAPSEVVLQSVGLPLNKFTVGILPGSRKKEVERLLPIMLDAAKLLYEENNKIQFLLMKAPTIDEDFMKRYTSATPFPIKIVSDQTYDGMNASQICMVASGTATLETAILEKPMVVVYKTSFLTWFLAKSFVKIPYIGLVNVVAGKKIVPECIQFDATPQKIAAELKNIFTNELKITEIKSGLAKVKSSLGGGGASRRAAEIISREV